MIKPQGQWFRLTGNNAEGVKGKRTINFYVPLDESGRGLVARIRGAMGLQGLPLVLSGNATGCGFLATAAW